jgi:hypothetical protein
MLMEYVSRYYRPAETALAQRMSEGARLGRSLDTWEGHLTRHWRALRFGRCEVTDAQRGSGFTLEVEVFLAELSASDIAVQLYADGDAPVLMTKVGSLPGTSNGYLFRITIEGPRPPADYTPRLVPASVAAAVPLEAALITWHD